MLYTGIDYHKKYSVVSTQDATGARVCEGKRRPGCLLDGDRSYESYDAMVTNLT